MSQPLIFEVCRVVWPRRAMVIIPAVLLSSLAIGCGRKPAGPVVYPVSGTVLFQGKPAKNVMVVFHAVGDAGQNIKSYAKTDAAGVFKLTTQQPQDGAPAGSYKITLLWPPQEDEEVRGLTDKLGGRYSDAGQSKLTFEVKPEPNTVPPIQLK